ncbi:MAG: prepilin-type N-terminal cleavage/methylation domain-containing protein [Candidatus Omnitrophota bacterium]
MKKGFTLVEIMIVVAIIALLAAIAIPNLLRARLNANESAAIATCQTLSTALQSYRAVNPATGFPAVDLASLAPAGQPPYVDATLAIAAPSRQGYNFAYNPGVADLNGVLHDFFIYASPITPNTTGVRGFYIDEGGVICGVSPAAAPVHAIPGSACPAAPWAALQ